MSPPPHRLFLLAALASSLSPCAAYTLTATASTRCVPRARVTHMKKGGGGGKKGGGAQKMVQVVLSVPIAGVGKAGDLVSVKPAYAENFVVRQGKGVVATPEKLKEIAAAEAAKAEAAVAAKAAAVEADAKLQAVFGEEGAVVKKNVGPDGAIFGSVTAADIAELLRDRAGLSVEKKNIKAPSLSSVGTGTAEVTLHREVVSKLKVVVVPA